MANQRIVVIGTSAGGIDALRELVGGLPADFPVPIALVMHISPESPGVLPDILTRAGRMRAVQAETGQRLRAGYIYVAPPDAHLLVEPGRLVISRGPRENRFRPAIDPLFRSAAQVYGPGAIGIVLTGNLDDGSAGLWAIKRLGGTAIVQAPEDAAHPSMPRNALSHVDVDHVVPLAVLPALLVQLTAASLHAPEPPPQPTVDVEVRIAREENPLTAGVEALGEPSTFTYPECHGVLLRVRDGGPIRFRCHTGHAFSASSLGADIEGSIERALWSAIRALQEGALFMKTLAEHVEHEHERGGGAAFAARSRELMQRADTLRAMVTTPEPEPVTSAVPLSPRE